MAFPVIPWAGLIFNKVTLGLVIAGAAVWAYTEHRQSLIQQGYDSAMRDVQDREDTRLREQVRETGRLTGEVERLNNEARALQGQVDLFAGRWRDAERLFADQESDFQRKLANASAEAVRKYAQASDRNLERCRQELGRFAKEAAAGSIAAWTLKNYIDAGPTCKPVEVTPGK